jgi:hypothetical protein
MAGIAISRSLSRTADLPAPERIRLVACQAPAPDFEAFSMVARMPDGGRWQPFGHFPDIAILRQV